MFDITGILILIVLIALLGLKSCEISGTYAMTPNMQEGLTLSN